VLTAALSLPFALAHVATPAGWSTSPITRPRPLSSVRLLDGPLANAVSANRSYLLAHDPDRLLAPFLREAGLDRKPMPTEIG
jgi:uncharacterized protein